MSGTVDLDGLQFSYLIVVRLAVQHLSYLFLPCVFQSLEFVRFRPAFSIPAFSLSSATWSATAIEDSSSMCHIHFRFMSVHFLLKFMSCGFIWPRLPTLHLESVPSWRD